MIGSIAKSADIHARSLADMVERAQCLYLAFVVYSCRYVHISQKRGEVAGKSPGIILHLPECATLFTVCPHLSTQTGKESLATAPSHHPDPLTVGADPGGTITDSPFIFFETGLADHKTTGATPAKFLLLFAAVTNILAGPFFRYPPGYFYGRTSSASQVR